MSDSENAENRGRSESGQPEYAQIHLQSAAGIVGRIRGTGLRFGRTVKYVREKTFCFPAHGVKGV